MIYLGDQTSEGSAKQRKGVPNNLVLPTLSVRCSFVVIFHLSAVDRIDEAVKSAVCLSESSKTVRQA